MGKRENQNNSPEGRQLPLWKINRIFKKYKKYIKKRDDGEEVIKPSSFLKLILKIAAGCGAAVAISLLVMSGAGLVAEGAMATVPVVAKLISKPLVSVLAAAGIGAGVGVLRSAGIISKISEARSNREKAIKELASLEGRDEQETKDILENSISVSQMMENSEAKKEHFSKQDEKIPVDIYAGIPYREQKGEATEQVIKDIHDCTSSLPRDKFLVFCETRVYRGNDYSYVFKPQDFVSDKAVSEFTDRLGTSVVFSMKPVIRKRELNKN